MAITTTSQSASRIKNAASGRTLETRLVTLFVSLTSSLRDSVCVGGLEIPSRGSKPDVNRNREAGRCVRSGHPWLETWGAHGHRMILIWRVPPPSDGTVTISSLR
jgi:hypothetical protein